MKFDIKQILIFSIFIILTAGSFSYKAYSATNIYIAPEGSDSAEGTLAAPFKTINKGLIASQPGDIVFVREGTYNESLIFPNAGTSENRITLKAYENETVIVQQTGQAMKIDKPYITVENIIFDGNWGADDVIKLRSEADFCILRGLEVKNTMRDTVDLSSPKGVLIENCIIHDAIFFEAGERIDAHGIVTEGVQDLTIKNTEIYYVSGDTLQFQYNGWDNIFVENCTLWNAPLPSARGGAPAGVYPGENAIDTKYYTEHGRGKLFVKNTTAYGWRSDYIVNASAFNIKHNVEAVFDGITVYDSEIAFRLRGPASSSTGGAWVTLKNAVIYDSNKGVRYEDDIENLHIYNLTFGNQIETLFQSAGGYGSGFEVKNCLFLSSSKPNEASDLSNIKVDSTAFVNSSLNDYHLISNSAAIDAGIVLPEVSIDRDGVKRPQKNSFDIGAYEFLPGDINNDRKLDLSDAIITLQICAGTPLDNIFIADVNKDKTIGLEEAAYILFTISNI